MKKIVIAVVIIAVVAAAFIYFVDMDKVNSTIDSLTGNKVTGNSGTVTPSPSPNNPGPSQGTGTTTTTTTTDPTPPAPPPPAEPEIPPGSLALFATLSGDTRTESIPIQGGTVSWDTTHYMFLRYIPEAQLLDEFGWTSSQSYAKSYIYGITAGDWVYVVKCFTDSGRKDISRLDPKTGKTVGSFPTIDTGDKYRGFAIVGDRLYYRTEVSKDLYGNRNGGGNVMVAEIGGSAAEVLDYYDENNQGRYYGIGDELITIVTTYENGDYFYDIYRVNPTTLALGALLFSYDSSDIVTFYEGETSLYWTAPDPDTGDTSIVKFTLSENPVYFLTIPGTTPNLLSVDEADGAVLVTFRDNSPDSPFYYLADVTTGDSIALDIDPAFFSQSIYGNGQFLILD